MIRIRSIVPPLRIAYRAGRSADRPAPITDNSSSAVTPLAAARHRRGPLLAQTRDAISMQLGIVDGPAFLADAIGTEAAVRVHHRLIPGAVAHVLLRRPIA